MKALKGLERLLNLVVYYSSFCVESWRMENESLLFNIFRETSEVVLDRSVPAVQITSAASLKKRGFPTR